VIPLGLDAVASVVEGELERTPDAEEITGVQVDSRRVAPGDLFVAVGRGVQFLDDARVRGAAATLVPREPFAAFAALGAAVRNRSSAKVVGITGSTGKTSTKDILAALCAPVARTVAAEASFNNEIGVPLTLCRLEPDTEVCIVELAMRGFGQIAELCAITRPDVGVVTNVGPVHLELVGSIEGVLRAKSELVAALPVGGTAIVPMDFPVEREDIDVIRLGEPEAGPDDGRTIVGGVSFNFTARHQTANAAAALAALDALTLPRPQRADVDFSRWRDEELPLAGGGLLINDAYNANPISMRAALDHLATFETGGRRLAVLGEMRELGPDAPAFHREVGEHARERGVEWIIGVGELASAYAPDEQVADAEAAADALAAALRPGDAVLVKGSRAVGLERVAEKLTGR